MGVQPQGDEDKVKALEASPCREKPTHLPKTDITTQRPKLSCPISLGPCLAKHPAPTQPRELSPPCAPYLSPSGSQAPGRSPSFSPPPESPSPTTSLLLPGSNFILGYTVTMTIDASPIQDTLK